MRNKFKLEVVLLRLRLEQDPDGRIFKSLWRPKPHSKIPLFLNLYRETNLVLGFTVLIYRKKVIQNSDHFFKIIENMRKISTKADFIVEQILLFPQQNPSVFAILNQNPSGARVQGSTISAIGSYDAFKLIFWSISLKILL